MKAIRIQTHPFELCVAAKYLRTLNQRLCNQLVKISLFKHKMYTSFPLEAALSYKVKLTPIVQIKYFDFIAAFVNILLTHGVHFGFSRL